MELLTTVLLGGAAVVLVNGKCKAPVASSWNSSTAWQVYGSSSLLVCVGQCADLSIEN
jgi:hypothetical protein